MGGRAKRMVVTKENSTIIDGVGDAERIQARIKQIKAQTRVTRTALQIGLPGCLGRSHALRVTPQQHV